MSEQPLSNRCEEDAPTEPFHSTGMRFERNLRAVATRLNVPDSEVRRWRDVDGCPFLTRSPYDVVAILQWLTSKADINIDPTMELDREKLSAEVEKLQREHKVFSRDKAFWIVVLALGISVSREIREWIRESMGGASKKTDEEQPSISIPKDGARRLPRIPVGVVQFEGKSPDGQETWFFCIDKKYLYFLAETGNMTKLMEAAHVLYVVNHATTVWKGLNRPGQDDALCYVGKPTMRRIGNPGIDVPAPKNSVFSVYIAPKPMKNGQLKVMKWGFVREHPIRKGFPFDYEDRLGDQL